MKTYKVNHIKLAKENSKVNFSQIWRKADCLTDFSSPWDKEIVKKIEFKAVHDSEKIFFRFKVFDEDVYTYLGKDKNESINNSDRVELFFRSDAKLNPYYCLEIDPRSKVMDFKAYPNKKFDFNWNWPSEHIKVKSNINNNYFVVYITICIQSLKKLSLLKGKFIETGIYRAKYNKIGKDLYKPTWITWVNPKTETPNFHTPSSFGVLELENFI